MDASDKPGYASHSDDADAFSRRHRSRSNLSDCGDRSAIIYVGIAQEEQDGNALRSAPAIKPWMPSQRNMKQWYGYTTERYRIPLLDMSKLHGLDVSANDYRINYMFYIDVFSDIGGTTATATKKNLRWCRSGSLNRQH